MAQPTFPAPLAATAVGSWGVSLPAFGGWLQPASEATPISAPASHRIGAIAVFPSTEVIRPGLLEAQEEGKRRAVRADRSSASQVFECYRIAERGAAARGESAGMGAAFGLHVPGDWQALVPTRSSVAGHP